MSEAKIFSLKSPRQKRERWEENDELTTIFPSPRLFSSQSADTSTVSLLNLSLSPLDSSLHPRLGLSHARESVFTLDLQDGINEFRPSTSLLFSSSLSSSKANQPPLLRPSVRSNGISSNSPPQPSSPPPKRKPSKLRFQLLNPSSSG